MRAVIYARYSSELQSDASIEDQVRLCRERLQAEGITFQATYADRAISGSTMLRSGIQALLDDAGQGKFDVVYAEALDRLSRDQADVASIYKRLRFCGIPMITLAEGEITELHVGLKGTMNALFLKDLADKTRRGLKGRVLAGRSAGGLCYGYDVVRTLGADGEAVRGYRKINVAEAAIVKRIFEEYAAGNSPIKIACQLNREHIPGPRGLLWRDTAIRGHRQRGTGILNNELYLGRLVWNRQRYVKDPSTGRRVSRRNTESALVIEQVQELRIIDDTVWQAVKARQAAADATPASQKIKASRFWEQRRASHILTGLVRCGCCQGTVGSVGRDYLACIHARKLKTCKNTKGIKRCDLETMLLDALKHQLMQPEHVKTFMAEYHAELNRLATQAQHTVVLRRQELASIKKKYAGLVDALCDGYRTAGLKEQLESMEARIKELEQDVITEPEPLPLLHPRLADLYSQKVGNLHAALADPALRNEALEIIRGLIEKVVLHQTEDGQEIEVVGDLVRMIDLARHSGKNSENASRNNVLFRSSVKVVAGAGFGSRFNQPIRIALLTDRQRRKQERKADAQAPKRLPADATMACTTTAA